MSRAKFATITADYPTFAAANAALSGLGAGSIVLVTGAPGEIYIVKLNGTTKVLAPVDASGVLGPWASRGLALVAVNGAPASGLVTYSATVLNGAGAPVPGALVQVGMRRAAGAGAGVAAPVTGTFVSALDVGGGAIALVIQASAAGVASWSLTGTAGDTWDTAAATDAPEGGQLDSDAGRVLP